MSDGECENCGTAIEQPKEPTTTMLNPQNTQLAELREALDNVTAALETCLLHYGSQMPPADQSGRRGVVLEARRLLSKLPSTLLAAPIMRLREIRADSIIRQAIQVMPHNGSWYLLTEFRGYEGGDGCYPPGELRNVRVTDAEIEQYGLRWGEEYGHGRMMGDTIAYGGHRFFDLGEYRATDGKQLYVFGRRNPIEHEMPYMWWNEEEGWGDLEFATAVDAFELAAWTVPDDAMVVPLPRKQA